jgi:hypothetical protein
MLLVAVSALANFVKRKALDRSFFRNTSRALISDPTIRDQVAATRVDQLFANVDVPAALQRRLAENARGLAGPLAGSSVKGRSSRSWSRTS